MLDVVRCFWGSPLACGGVGHQRAPRCPLEKERSRSVRNILRDSCVRAASVDGFAVELFLFVQVRAMELVCHHSFASSQEQTLVNHVVPWRPM